MEKRKPVGRLDGNWGVSPGIPISHTIERSVIMDSYLKSKKGRITLTLTLTGIILLLMSSVLFLSAKISNAAIGMGGYVDTTVTPTAPYPPTGETVFFPSNYDGNFDIYWIPLAGGSWTGNNLTTGTSPEVYDHPTIDPNGKNLLYTYNDGTALPTVANTYIKEMDLTTGTVIDLWIGSHPRYSEDRLKIVYSKEFSTPYSGKPLRREIWVATRASTSTPWNDVSVTHAKLYGDSSNDAIHGDFSPDGSKIVFMKADASNYQPYKMWIVDSNGSNPHDATPSSIWAISSPSYSPVPDLPDAKIVFLSDGNGDGLKEMYIVDVDHSTGYGNYGAVNSSSIVQLTNTAFSPTQSESTVYFHHSQTPPYNTVDFCRKSVSGCTVTDKDIWKKIGITGSGGETNLTASPGSEETCVVSSDCSSPIQLCPTLIDLISFTAKGRDGKVVLKWETASEIDNAGFNIWRFSKGDEKYIKINPSLIPAEGSPIQGAAYTYIDTNVVNKTTYFYALEDIDFNGVRTYHGRGACTFGEDPDCRPVRAIPHKRRTRR